MRDAVLQRQRPLLVGCVQRSLRVLIPNPLVELTRYGIGPGPRVAAVHLESRGPGATPPRAVHRERSTAPAQNVSVCHHRRTLTVARIGLGMRSSRPTAEAASTEIFHCARIELYVSNTIE